MKIYMIELTENEIVDIINTLEDVKGEEAKALRKITKKLREKLI